MSKINNFQTEWQAAINILEPMRLEAVQEIRSQIEPIDHALSREGQRLTLLEILMAYEPSTDGAEAALSGYMGSFVKQELIQDGNHILQAFGDVLNKNMLRGNAAKQAANALFCACSGKVAPGLTDWPKLETWGPLMFSPKGLLVWVSLLMPDQAEKFERSQQSLDEKRLELTAMLERLNGSKLSF